MSRVLTTHTNDEGDDGGEDEEGGRALLEVMGMLLG